MTRTNWRERWENAALLVGLLALAGAAGVRPAAVGEVVAAGRLALVLHGAFVTGGDPTAAATAAQRWAAARAFRPDDPLLQRALVAQLLRTARLAGDEATARRAATELARFPAHSTVSARALWLQGATLLDDNRPEAAITLLEAALRRAGDERTDTLVRQTLAAAYHAGRRWTEAEQIYEGLLEARPTDHLLQNNLAYLLAEADRDLPRGEALSEQALAGLRRDWLRRLTDRREYARTEAMYLDTRAWLHYQADRLQVAEALLRQAVEIGRRDPDATILYHLARVCYDLGLDRDADQFVSRALALEPAHAEARRLADRLRHAPADGPIG